jgi:hypothetical protein
MSDIGEHDVDDRSRLTVPVFPRSPDGTPLVAMRVSSDPERFLYADPDTLGWLRERLETDRRIAPTAGATRNAHRTSSTSGTVRPGAQSHPRTTEAQVPGRASSPPLLARQPDTQGAEGFEPVSKGGGEILAAFVADDRQPGMASRGRGDRPCPCPVQVLGG